MQPLPSQRSISNPFSSFELSDQWRRRRWRSTELAVNHERERLRAARNVEASDFHCPIAARRGLDIHVFKIVRAIGQTAGLRPTAGKGVPQVSSAIRRDHGQIKIALKTAGRSLDDEEIGQATWDVWMEKGKWS